MAVGARRADVEEAIDPGPCRRPRPASAWRRCSRPGTPARFPSRRPSPRSGRPGRRRRAPARSRPDRSGRRDWISTPSPVEELRPARRADQGPHPVSPGDQPLGDVAPQQPGRPGDEDPAARRARTHGPDLPEIFCASMTPMTDREAVAIALRLPRTKAWRNDPHAAIDNAAEESILLIMIGANGKRYA